MTDHSKKFYMQKSAGKLSVILSMDEGGIIGAKGKLPWHLPADLRYFRKITLGHPIIMGRKTFESIGRLLDGRINIVITSRNIPIDGVIVARSFDDAIAITKQLRGVDEEIFAIGGYHVYEEALPRASRLYLTTVMGKFSGDTFAPKINFAEWKEISRQKHVADDKNKFSMEFIVYQK